MAMAAARYEIIEDRYLVAAALTGRREAYDELARRYRGAVILVAWRLVGCREAAQDIAQEAFLAGFQRLRQLKDPRQFGAWVRVIAQNLARRQIRVSLRTRPVELLELDRVANLHEDAASRDPMVTLLRKERETAIQDLISALPDGVQMVLQLYYREQWSVAQVAEFLGLTKTTVKWRLHAGRKQITRGLLEMAAEESGALHHREGAIGRRPPSEDVHVVG